MSVTKIPLPDSLTTELEADVYRAVKAVQDATPENLTTEIEKQVYNAVLAAGGGGGGTPGKAATVDVGTTTTLPPGADATVTNSGTTSAAVLNFGIPRGEKGVDGVNGAASCLVDYTRSVNVPLTESEGAYTMDNTGIALIDGLAVASISMTGSGNLTSRYFYISVNGVTIYSGRLATATGAVNAHCFPFTVKKGDTFIVAASKEVTVTYSVRIYPFIDTVYSTSEQVIGTWIDGKPLYRKVVIPNTPTAINVMANTDVSTLNIETVTRMEGYYYWDSSHNVTPMVFNNASVSATLVLSNRVSLQLVVTAKSWLNAKGQIILEYTKTTDAGTVDAASLLSTERVIPEATDLASLASAAEAIASMTRSSLEMSAPETVTDPAA